MSATEQRLIDKYGHLLDLSMRYRASVATTTRLPSINTALRVVRERLAMLRDRKLAA